MPPLPISHPPTLPSGLSVVPSAPLPTIWRPSHSLVMIAVMMSCQLICCRGPKMLSSVGPVASITPWARLHAICCTVGNVLADAVAAANVLDEVVAAAWAAECPTAESEVVLVVVSGVVVVVVVVAAAGAVADCVAVEAEPAPLTAPVEPVDPLLAVDVVEFVLPVASTLDTLEPVLLWLDDEPLLLWLDDAEPPVSAWATPVVVASEAHTPMATAPVPSHAETSL